MVDVKDFTGAVNVNADITPITRRKINSVSPELWHEMDIEHLWEQRLTLNERMILAYQSGHADLGKQIQAGINRIDVMLQIREREKSKNM